MHSNEYELKLQFFGGEGAAPGGEGGEGSTAEGAANAGQQTLEDLGVPRDKAERYRARTAYRQAKPEAEPTAPAAQENPAEVRMSLEEVLKDPAENAKFQEMFKDRLKKDKGELEKRRQLDDVLRIVAKKAGMDFDIETTDISALLTAVEGDTSYFEEEAFRTGESVEDLAEKARQTRLDRDRKQTQLAAHFKTLQNQAEELKKTVPDFDLNTALQDQTFFNMTSPTGGASVEQAYYAVNGKRLLEEMEATAAQRAAQALSNSVRAGGKVPAENGGSGRVQAPPQEKLYSQMNKEERAAYYYRLTGRKYDR